jgi:nucleoporin POM152
MVSCAREISELICSARDVGATVSFDFNGVPPFSVEYTEQRNKQRPVTRSARFNSHAGEITLTPENEGEYTYVSRHISRRAGR